MKKKYMALITALAIVSTLFTGCNSEDTGVANEVGAIENEMTNEETEVIKDTEIIESESVEENTTEFEFIVIDYLTEAEVTDVAYSVNEDGRPYATVTHEDGTMQYHILYEEEGEILWNAVVNGEVWGGDYKISDVVEANKIATIDEDVEVVTPTPVPEETDEPTSTEPAHEHSYTGTVTKNATCSEKGVKTYTCSCGESYTEEISTTSHQYGEYISDGNAKHVCDGTKTATCSICGNKNTIIDEGSKIPYTFTEMSGTWYSTVIDENYVYSDPSGVGRIGYLTYGEAVTLTGICNESGLYRIDYNGTTAYTRYLAGVKPNPQ